RAIVTLTNLAKFVEIRVMFSTLYGQSLQKSEKNVKLKFSEGTCVARLRNSTPSWLMLTIHGDGQPLWTKHQLPTQITRQKLHKHTYKVRWSIILLLFTADTFLHHLLIVEVHIKVTVESQWIQQVLLSLGGRYPFFYRSALPHLLPPTGPR
uniref:Uncharacterized protein n=1 Tax=Takifugu rubripes TaxID=31033 RepID=A0A674PP96_TAKRU